MAREKRIKEIRKSYAIIGEGTLTDSVMRKKNC